MNNNPYQPPPTHHESRDRASLPWSGTSPIYSWEGRINRLWYALMVIGINVVAWTIVIALVISSIDSPNFALGTFWLPLVVSNYFNIVLGIKRLHDTGQSGWLILLKFVPLANWGLFFYLLFYPGESGANQYGDPPDYVPSANAYQQERVVPSSPAELAAAARANPDNLDLWETYFKQSLATQDRSQIMRSGKHLIRLHITADELPEALQCWSDLKANQIDVGYAVEYKLARQLVENNYPAEGTAVLRSAAEKGVNLDQLANVAKLAARVDATLAREILDNHPDIEILPAHERLEIETLRSQLDALPPVPASPAQHQQDPYADPYGDPFGNEEPTPPVPVHTFMAVPQAMEASGLALVMADSKRSLLPYHAIKVMSLGAMQQASGKPFMILALVLAPNKNGERQMVRIPVNKLNPSQLVPDAGTKREAFNLFLQTLQQRSGARPYPDMNALLGNPVSHYDSLESFEAMLFT